MIIKYPPILLSSNGTDKAMNDNNQIFFAFVPRLELSIE